MLVKKLFKLVVNVEKLRKMVILKNLSKMVKCRKMLKTVKKILHRSSFTPRILKILFLTQSFTNIFFAISTYSILYKATRRQLTRPRSCSNLILIDP